VVTFKHWKENGPAGAATPRDPAHNPTEVDVDDVSVNREVLAGDPFPLGATRSDEIVEAHYAVLSGLRPPTADMTAGCT
jgi:hypothetical protein